MSEQDRNRAYLYAGSAAQMRRVKGGKKAVADMERRGRELAGEKWDEIVKAVESCGPPTWTETTNKGK